MWRFGIRKSPRVRRPARLRDIVYTARSADVMFSRFARIVGYPEIEPGERRYRNVADRNPRTNVSHWPKEQRRVHLTENALAMDVAPAMPTIGAVSRLLANSGPVGPVYERRFHGQWPDAVQAPMGGTLAYKRGVICDAEANYSRPTTRKEPHSSNGSTSQVPSGATRLGCGVGSSHLRAVLRCQADAVSAS